MAPPAGEQNGGESTVGEPSRSLPTPFLTKTYQLVDDPAIDDIISWNEDGSTFVVWNPAEFARDLLPKYFKHNNFSSFVRQLNTYGFRKVVPDRWEFSNDCFRKGEKRLLCDIQRRKLAAPAAAAATVTVVAAAAPAAPLQAVSPMTSGEEQVISSSSSPATPGSAVDLMDENERLRKENVQLNKELNQMKSLCNNIYSLMSNYASNRPESCSAAVRQLDLLPAKRCAAEESGGADHRTEPEEETSPKLFGVALGLGLGAKRQRETEGESAEQSQELRLQQPGTDVVKSEPLDHHQNSDNQEMMCLRQCHRPNQRVCN